ncbi:hypothetical protein ACH5RR_019662 [Cinchona calisaya]|uniref:Uncharacterized protein n=1 Tax=Cinchona calisaya TaxID=153742 RepID=A0ABD2ZR89_9GENT
MDKTTKKNCTSAGGPSSCWTNEKHMRFLNSIEASFVRNMYENNNHRSSPRLDRQLPDCFESTQDLGKERRRRHSTSDVGEYSSTLRTDKKNKRLSSHDQVVPQLENRIEDGIKDENEKEKDDGKVWP